MPPERLGPPTGQPVAGLPSAKAERAVYTIVATVIIAILTNGPSIALSHHYNVPLGWERWPYMLPMGGAALLGFLLCGRDLRYEQLWRSRWPLAFLSVYLVWCAASVLWSVAPDATAVRSLITAGVSAFGVWYALCLRFKEQVLSLFAAMTALSVWSLGLIIFQPHTHQIYPPPQYPEWHTAVFGVFGNPNSLGPVAALSVLSAIAVWVLFPSWPVRVTTLAAGVIGIILTLWSQCLTAVAGLGLCLLALCVALALPFLRRLSGWLVGGSIVVAVVVAWNVFFDNIARIAPAVGESVTLSSRRLIWRDVRSSIALRPWRGYGFFAFWDNEAFTAQTYQHLGSSYGSAHNSILEVALGLGRIGLVVYVGLALFMIVGTARALWLRTSSMSVAWVVIAVFLIVQNSMESFVLWHSYLWAMFVAATLVPSRMGASPRAANQLEEEVPWPEGDTDGAEAEVVLDN